MGKKLEAFRENILNCAKQNGGLAVVEVFLCDNCKVEFYAIHKMRETVKCCFCGHSHASKFPRYQSVCDIGADAR